MKVLAIIPVFNEMDILPYTVDHLLHQGLNIHIIDNWSTDGMKDTFRYDRFIKCERFPEQPSKYYEWSNILKRVEEVAAQSDADWCMLNDADEIRYSNVQDEPLIDAFERVDKQRFTAVNFRTFHYILEEDMVGPPEQHFTKFTVDNVKQIKAWKNICKVDLHSSGGHDVEFKGKDVYIPKFTLKHYPFRSQAQRQRKLFKDRNYLPEELANGWHVHYNELKKELNEQS